MLFSSIAFMFYFLPIVVIGYLAIAYFTRQAFIYLWLTAASLFFYGYWNPPYLLLLAGSIIVNYTVGRALIAHRTRKILIAGLAFNLAMISYFKYADFFIANTNDLFGLALPQANIVLPLAISFFTFQQIAYLVDAYRGKIGDTSFLHYALFVSFFPQLIAGPIVHHAEIIPQFEKPRARIFEPADMITGIAIFVIGLQKKVVLADGIAPHADLIFSQAATAPPLTLDAWSGALAYAFQIYFDFSGYTDMAIGLARFFGIDLPRNFNSPYKAANIIEFWRRWHMTLSRFLRDYLYIPLGGNRKGTWRRHANIMVTMLLGGLWHGAAWTFVIWGGLHGLFLVVNHGFHWVRRRLGQDPDRSTALGRAVGRVLTLLAVVTTWVIFRAHNWHAAVAILLGMAGFNGGRTLSQATGFEEWAWLAVMGVIVLFLPNTLELVDGGRIPQILRAHRMSWGLPVLTVAGIVGALIILAKGSASENFIYMVF